MDEMYLAKHILKMLGYLDWTVKKIESGGGLCCHNLREIWLDAEFTQSVPWIMHEVAHIAHPDHTAHWADHYTALMHSYLYDGLHFGVRTNGSIAPVRESSGADQGQSTVTA